MEIGGTAGRLLSGLPGGSGPTVETTFLKGNRIRHDQDDSESSIVNSETGILTLLDHRARTFSETNLVEVAEAVEESAKALDGELGEVADAVAEGAEAAAQEGEQQYREEGGDQLVLEVFVESSRTGRTENISGYSAEQVITTLEIKGGDDRADWNAEDTKGGLAIVTEVWLSTDFPEYQMMAQMQGAALQQIQDKRTDEGLLGTLEHLLKYDPRVKFAFEKNKETLDAMDGVPLRTTMHFVNLPDEARLDLDQVLAEKDRSLMDDASDAVAESAKDAAKSAVGGVTGRLFGRKKKAEPKPEPEAPAQSVFFRIVSEISDVESASLPEDLFEVPPTYAPVAGSAGASGR